MRSYRTRKTHKKQRGGFMDALKGLFGFGISGESIATTDMDLPEPIEDEMNENSLPTTEANMVGGRRSKTKKSKKSVRKTHKRKSHRRRHH